jgi:hypothetical protein
MPGEEGPAPVAPAAAHETAFGSCAAAGARGGVWGLVCLLRPPAHHADTTGRVSARRPQPSRRPRRATTMSPSDAVAEHEALVGFSGSGVGGGGVEGRNASGGSAGRGSGPGPARSCCRTGTAGAVTFAHHVGDVLVQVDVLDPATATAPRGACRRSRRQESTREENSPLTSAKLSVIEAPCNGHLGTADQEKPAQTAFCAPGRTRTHDPLLRRQPLYPSELLGHSAEQR